ncbi:dihydrodipicolinate synthase family protein [Limimaricola pyoseonensis]|uniref:4-hydroxy-tetrahydrodipicolinate synthase n=1 Tax=Limimaricola pyoseonensis TaxID=521013 RepID=A0A1G7FKZ9_9RHOB|nr:dihydrodipicolinate synthase family protein [Limimaricola pyoseonensis]SDE76572.1 4-hydroxy-tetrahydrodipicolinate synthase [Limimaricola pyoseonensis]
MSPTPIRGVLAAIATPFDAGDRPDTALFLRHARWLLENGCDGLNVLGTTGEANSIGADARMTLMTAAAAGFDPARMMVGTGCPDLETTVALTRHAAECGYAGALVLPPYYYKGVSDDGLFAFFAALVARTADRPVPIYLYNFPQMTGLRLAPAIAARLKAAFPDRIAGAKDSSGDLDYAAALAAIPGFDVFPSDESALAQAPVRGFAGCISATVNLTAPLAGRLRADPGDAGLAEELGRRRAAISRTPLIPSVKALVARLHDAPGYATVLPPLAPLTPEQEAALPPAAVLAAEPA